MRLVSDQGGFTLIEFIVVMVILGILMFGGFFGLREVMDGYTLAKANTTSTQKAQNALARISIELSRITYNTSSARYTISSGSANSITYTANFGGADETHTIDQNGNLVRFDTNDNLILCDQVVTNGLQFSYLDGNGTVVAATNVDMRLIQVSLTVQVTSTATRTFTTRVALQQ